MILKLKQTPGIYLVGFMGCGKSTVGSALADELGWCFYDLDREIEKTAGTSVAEIFDQRGEGEFRTLETEALKKRVQNVRTGRPQVIALGGGAFAIEENVALASNHGVTIWLDVPLAVIQPRIAAETHRPLARDPQRFQELYDVRRQSYARADYRIEALDQAAADVVAGILALPLFRP
ncbi:MAG: shikimate kinase [Acidobacteriota bacterium]